MLQWAGRLGVSVIGGAVVLGTAWWAVTHTAQERRIAELEAERTALLQVIERFKIERRVARLFVSDQRHGPDGRVASSTVEFATLDADGQPSNIRSAVIPGDVCYVDALVVRFLDTYIEQGDPLRGHSLHLFRRLFGEGQSPASGVSLDEPGAVPTAYRADPKLAEFEKRLWSRFWEYASNPKAAAELGVRVAQGEAVYQHVRKGQLWRISTRADGGLEMTLEPVDPLILNHLVAPSTN